MKTFGSIQHLRALAALMVVVFHLLQPARGIVYPAFASFAGAAGVDIFFVISGFIIYVSQTEEDRGVADFVRRRLTRIMPLYWLFTLVLIVLHLAVHMNPDLSLAWPHLVQSLLLIPHTNPTSGKIEPLLVVGWTLQYELFFYALFAVGLVVAPRRRVLWLCFALLGLVALGALMRPEEAIAASYTNPRLLEFLAGVLLGAAVRLRPQMFPASGWVGIPVGLAALLATDWAGEFWRQAWGWGPPAVLIVAGALCLDLNGKALKAPWLRLLGDASYSIYLTHLITLGVVRQAWRLAIPPSPSPAVFAAFAAVALTLAVAVGVVVYGFVERPWLRRLNALIGQSPMPRLAARTTSATGANAG